MNFEDAIKVANRFLPEAEKREEALAKAITKQLGGKLKRLGGKLSTRVAKDAASAIKILKQKIKGIDIEKAPTPGYDITFASGDMSFLTSAGDLFFESENIDEVKFKVDTLDIEDVNILAKKLGLGNIDDKTATNIMQILYKKHGRKNIRDKHIEDELKKIK